MLFCARLAALALVAALPSASRASAPAAGSPRAEAAPAPRLVVVVAVDQLVRTRIGPDLPGGLGRLLREGRVFADATLDHAASETCPGHATLLTGMNPGPAGIPGNVFFQDGQPVYCVADADPQATPDELRASSARAGVLGVPETADPKQQQDALRSPRRLLVDALGDWLPEPRKVFSISAKDRAAMMMGGRRPTLAVWLDPRAGFTTSRHYAAALPPWLVRFDRERGLVPFDPARHPEAWRHPADDPRAFPDDERYESGRFSRTSPHPVRGDSLAHTVDGLLRTPYVDALTLDLARTVVEAEGLGAGPGTALLAVSLSSTDYIGHAYGPDSQEALAGLRTLDAQLGDFLRFLERRVPRDRLLLVLTADHGASTVPELAEELGASTCRMPGGRVDGRRLVQRIAEAARDVCGLDAAPAVGWDSNAAFSLPPALFTGAPPACRAQRDDALRTIAVRVGVAPGVVKVWTPSDLDDPGCVGACLLQRHSWAPGRGGDLLVQLDPGCLLSGDPAGGGHGSPYLYDRAVPLVFWGAGVRAGIVRGPAHTIDIAPTLAARLGIAPPRPLDGHALPLR